MIPKREIPGIRVIEWQYRGLFGRVKTTWVLPPVRLGAWSRVNATKRYGISPKGASER